MVYSVRLEQTSKERKRMKYNPVFNTFSEKDYECSAKRPYGWIMETGTPPCDHLDALVMTDRPCCLGEVIQVRVVGVFYRHDYDHKLVTVPLDRTETDFSELPENEQEELLHTYPIVFEDEGWFGREKAEEIIAGFMSKKKRKTIITVQHTQSEHHVNGMIGAWGNWNLTEAGRKQAYDIGKFLENEVADKEYYMYVSDLNRTIQTAEEMNRTLKLVPEVREILREVNAGAGNGQTREWYNQNKKPEHGYDPDYKPFDDGESDRELWARIYPFYQEIISNEKENILVVSHGTTLSFLQSMLMRYTFEDIRRSRFNGCGGSVSRFSINTDGKVTAEYINYRLG